MPRQVSFETRNKGEDATPSIHTPSAKGHWHPMYAGRSRRASTLADSKASHGLASAAAQATHAPGLPAPAAPLELEAAAADGNLNDTAQRAPPARSARRRRSVLSEDMAAMVKEGALTLHQVCPAAACCCVS